MISNTFTIEFIFKLLGFVALLLLLFTLGYITAHEKMYNEVQIYANDEIMKQCGEKVQPSNDINNISKYINVNSTTPSIADWYIDVNASFTSKPVPNWSIIDNFNSSFIRSFNASSYHDCCFPINCVWASENSPDCICVYMVHCEGDMVYYNISLDEREKYLT